MAVPAEKIKVTISDGRIKLEGDVDGSYQKDDAEHAPSATLPGVNGVTNLIAVKPVPHPTEARGQDRGRLPARRQLNARRITVKVTAARSSCAAPCDSFAEKSAATTAAWSAPGVSSVENLIIVEP